MRVELHPEARAELRAAALWYDTRRPGLGDEFISEVSATLDRIAEAPASFPTWPGALTTPSSIRRAVVERFSSVIAFEVQSDHIADKGEQLWRISPSQLTLQPCPTSRA